MTVFIELEAYKHYDAHRDHFWRSGYIDQSQFRFRDTREFLERYQFSKTFDTVLFISAGEVELDLETNAKVKFYLDKLAKSTATRARSRSVAIVTSGTVGLGSELCSNVKTYTGSKGVQVTTIGVSPHCTTDVGHHNTEIVGNGHILKAAPGFDIHLLVHHENEQPGQAPALSLQFEVMMNLISGLVSKVGSIMPVFAQQSAEAGLLDFMCVPVAVSEGTQVNPVIVQGLGGIGDAIVELLNCDDVARAELIKVEDQSLASLELKYLQTSALTNLLKCRHLFVLHSLNSDMPDILPTGVTLDKTGRPAWETILDMKHFH